MYLIVLITFFMGCTNNNRPKNDMANDTQTVTKMRAIETEEISYSTEDGLTMTGFLAKPALSKGSIPGVLVVHEWWGHNEYARNRAKMLAEMGYAALAIDMYGDGKQASHPEDAQKFAMSVMGNLESAQARFDVAMETLLSKAMVDSSKVAAIGYCFGGSVVLTMANLGKPLAGVVSFHGGLQLPAQPEKGLNTKFLVLNGEADPFVKEEDKTAFKASMDNAMLDYEFVEYPDAVHAFTNPGADSLGQKFGLPLAYQAQADSASWSKMKKFFNTLF
jgi:dienelactone hydrolase